MAETVEKLATGAPLTIDQLLEYLPEPKGGFFDHAKHQIHPATQKPLDCNVCHSATQSRETSDVLMPGKASCTTCHSPQCKVVAECITCHTYHAPLAAQILNVQR
ncbi:MAG TPA: cytochrome c3 family protein [Chthoniobacterales bacterium]|jgi:hypothetical protein|nr:cytochrome c3 family protein [Chthoniobacterales bacterium]